MKFGDYPKVGSFDDVASFRAYLASQGLEMPCEEVVEAGPSSPLGKPLIHDGMTIGHRIGAQPMEGWDCEADGNPSDNARRRWQRFGASGAKMVWGGEACAVRPDGRANPKQLVMAPHTVKAIAELREIVVKAHRQAMDDDKGLVIGLQLSASASPTTTGASSR